MTIEEILEQESRPLFRVFLRKIWFRNYDDYINLFGDDIAKREETVLRFLDNLPYLFRNNSDKWRTSYKN